MSDFQITLNLTANGNISPFSFVKGDPSNAFFCLQAGAGDQPIGISGQWTHYPPGVPGDDGFEATATEQPMIFAPLSVVGLKCGTAWTPFQYLKPDASGFGQPATSPLDPVGAIALDAASPGEISRVLVLPPSQTNLNAPVLAPAGNLTLAGGNSGALVYVNSVSAVITLPLGVVGYRAMVLNGPTAVGSGTGTTIAMNAADSLAGNGYTPAAGKGAVNTQATAVSGDYLEVECVAANLWYVVRKQGTWARVA